MSRAQQSTRSLSSASPFVYLFMAYVEPGTSVLLLWSSTKELVYQTRLDASSTLQLDLRSTLLLRRQRPVLVQEKIFNIPGARIYEED